MARREPSPIERALAARYAPKPAVAPEPPSDPTPEPPDAPAAAESAEPAERVTP